MSFEFSMDELEGFPVFMLEGNLIERHEADDLLIEIDECIAQGSNRLIVNLEDLEYLNSSGLNVLLNILTRCRNHGGETVICGINERLKKLLVITKLDAVFQLASSCEAAANRLVELSQPAKNT